MFVNPPRDESLGPDARGARVVLGEAILTSLFRYVGTTQSYESERGLATSYTLLGDPATRVSVGRPSTTITVNGMPVTSPMRLHTPGNALRIEAELVSNIRLDSLVLLRDLGAGAVEIPNSDYQVTPAFPDTGVASAFGGRRFALTYETTIEPRNADYTILVRDRNGLVQRSVVSLRLEAVLRSSGGPLLDDDAVAPAATLSLLLLSPKAIANPLEELQLQVNGHPQEFTASAVPTDLTETGAHSGREWVLSWTHADYPIDNYVVTLLVQNGASVTRRFRVTEASGQLGLRDLIPFPNPFDAGGTNFSFMLLGGAGAEVKVNVFTQSGRLIYSKVEHDLAPGYHQLAWNGRDSEGDDIANGVYFFRITATTSSGASTRQLGRLVKLRAPRHTD
jgi:hypothetical protein